MRAEIITVGTELLLGDILNTNARFLARELAALGYSVYYQSVVGDNQLRLRSLVQEAKGRSDVLILTGGLGPTEDDLTKETVAEAFGDTLVLDHEALAELESFFDKLGRPMTENNRKQAMVPRRGRKIPNPNGTAPGAVFRQGDCFAFLLPGPPREMEAMFSDYVRPVLEQMQDAAIRSVVLRTFGIGESDLETKVRDLLENKNPTAALYAKTGEVHIRITARADTAAQAELMCQEYAELFQKVLGTLIYSADEKNLETVVVETLLQNGETVATAESCTGGLLSERITSVPGASGVFGYGATTYANEVKHSTLGVKNSTLKAHGAVSGQVAAEMAFGAAAKGEADYGVGITGIAGPDGGNEVKPVGLVYVAVSAKNDVYLKKLNLADRGRAFIREIASSHALDMVRRLAQGLSIPNAKKFKKSEQADFDREGKPLRRGSGIVRMLVALLLVAALAALLIGGMYWSGRLTAQQQPEALAALAGLRYGTQEYTAAACAIVARQNEQTPSVVGLVALPNGPFERLVRQDAKQQSQLLTTNFQPADETQGDIAADAPLKAQTNTVVQGGAAFAPLAAYKQQQEGLALSTFSYFTAREARVYKVFAVLLLDGGEEQADGFDPAVQNLGDYQTFLSFFLGAKARSLYELPVDVQETDGFMTLALPDEETSGRQLLLCGRLLRPGENIETEPGAPAGSTLMPAAYYAESGQQMPDVANLYASWLGWFLNRHITNSELQLQAGMPGQDVIPLPPQQVENQPDASEPDDESTSDSGASQSSTSASLPQSTSAESATTGSASAESAQSAPAVSSQSVSSSQPASSSAVSASSGTEEEGPYFPNAGTLTVTMNGKLVSGSTTDILAQICQREAASFEKAAIQAQAIAAHSWIRNQQLAGNPAPYVVGAPASATVRQAVAEVADYVLSGNGSAPAFTPWHALAAQGTNDAQIVFGGTRPYLVSVPSPHDEANSGWRTITTVPRAAIAEMAQQNLGISLEEWGEPEQWLSQLTVNESGYVESLSIGGEQVGGLHFWRQLLVRDGAPLLQSPAFEVEFDGENFNFIGYGQGHGCGMSQAGANAYAREGWGYERILLHYYPGLQLLMWK